MTAVKGRGGRTADARDGSDREDGRRASVDTSVQPAVVVVDAMRSADGSPAFVVQSLAQLACHRGFDVAILCGADVELTRKECERAGANVVLLPIYLAPTGGRPLMEALSLWELPAVLCGELAKHGLLVVAVLVGAPAALLSACVAVGAIGVTGTDDLNRTLRNLRDVLVSSGSTTSSLSGTIRSQIDQSPLPHGWTALMTLTWTERRVLNAMMQGWSASDIASALVVSLATVRTHIRSILGKLDVSSQLAAVAIGYGVEYGTYRPRIRSTESEASGQGQAHVFEAHQQRDQEERNSDHDNKDPQRPQSR
jgi:DNA-binding NarL/FixJ family response regulator